METALALLAGSFIGAVLGFIGAGGAMLSVPILIYIFDFTPLHASTAALIVVFCAAAAGAVPKLRKGEVLVWEALTISGLGLVTNLGGSILSKNLSANTITTGFAVVLMIAGSAMLKGPIKDHPEKKMPVLILIVLSLVIGALTGVFGIGGGFLAIPILVLFFHTPQNKAAGTSLLIICLNTGISLLGHRAQWGDVQWHIPILMAGAALVIATFASHHASKAPAKLMRNSFAVLLFSVSLFTIAKTWIF